MLKNITLSAEEILIKQAREKARKRHVTLNNIFRNWLKNYLSNNTITEDYKKFMNSVDYINSGRKFTREEMNER